ncbi:hypothetical protein NUSPORA_01080 [Nucleospora cyclopteri]
MYETLLSIGGFSIFLLAITQLTDSRPLFTIPTTKGPALYQNSTVPYFWLMTFAFIIPLCFVFLMMRNENVTFPALRCFYLFAMYDSLLGATGITEFLKYIVSKKRPDYVSRQEVIKKMKANDEFISARYEEINGTKSFPSGHTASISTFTVTMPFVLKKEKYSKSKIVGCFIVFWCITIIVGATRISDNKHDITDVIVGGLIGVIIAVLVVKLVNKKIKEYEAQNVLTEDLGSKRNI